MKFAKFDAATIEVWEWISNFTPHYTVHAIIYPCQNFLWGCTVCLLPNHRLVCHLHSWRRSTLHTWPYMQPSISWHHKSPTWIIPPANSLQHDFQIGKWGGTTWQWSWHHDNSVFNITCSKGTCHDANFNASGGTGGCHNDNLCGHRCQQLASQSGMQCIDLARNGN